MGEDISTSDMLTSLAPGQLVPFGGDRVAAVSPELAEAFEAGDRLVVVQETGDLLRVPRDVHATVAATVGRATEAFAALASCTDEQITAFFDHFANLLDDDDVFAPIAEANASDVESARTRGRSTTRLALGDRMRADMVAGLRSWRDVGGARSLRQSSIDHGSWRVEAYRAPLGVVGFVFEGRPNVFADAVGVLRTGNTVVFRIGSDALGTARAIMSTTLEPALERAGLPSGAVGLVDAAERSAGWALFGDRRLSLAVARGSGSAVAQLGAVARQAGVPVSLHGTGGAWLVAGPGADRSRLASSVESSLDRKVCNTLNVCCIDRSVADELVPVFLDAVRGAAGRRDAGARIHVESSTWPLVVPTAVSAEVATAEVAVRRADGVHHEPFMSPIAVEALGTEWEWEESPEVTLVVVDDVDAAVELFNAHSPHFVASLIDDDAARQERFYAAVDAPFVGDGFTRWVDGQYALDTPELGLSNWEGGRLLSRSAVLSGDAVHTVRLRATIADPDLRR